MRWLLFSFGILSILQFVTSQSNRAPYFTNDWHWKMYENERLGARPRSVLTNEEIGLTAYDWEGRPLTFTVKGDAESSYFTVDSKTGVVKLRKSFDREVFSKYRARFSVSDGTSEDVQEAEVTILDVNDNRPLFDQVRYNVTIPEKLPIGSEVVRVSASDPDYGFGGIVSYYIEESDPIPFTMNGDSGVLTLRNNIDYESASMYRLVAEARDRDTSNPMTSSVVVVINVEDVQDSEPIFENLPYDRRIDENTAQGTSVVFVTAVDGDRGKPNNIAYSLVAGNDAGKFLLDSSTGEVRVASRIDRDAPGFSGVFRLTVRATEMPTRGSDGGAFREVGFEIAINDLNDEPPRFERNQYRLRLPEDTPVGTSLPLTIPVVDNDQGANSDVTMSVDWRNNGIITISPITFRRRADVRLILTKPLDYETQRRRRFKIFANETNSPRLNTACDITIEVSNVNDNIPIFEQIHYQTNVSESAEVGAQILQVVANDADAGSYGRVTYSLENAHGEVTIGSKNGQIQLLQQLDYEEDRRKQYIIRASDSGPQSATSLVTLNVIDENDNAPVFETLPSVTVRENTRVMRLSVIKANDADSYPHDVITYSLTEGSYTDYFAILTQDGVGILNLEEPLDYESLGDSIEIVIAANDSLFRSIASLVVNIEDENDQKPEFVQISNFTVKENIGGGISVGSILAEDLDSGRNGELYYYVTEGQEEFGTVFRLNEKTGDITTKPGTSPDYEAASYYDITVMAQDGGNSPLSASVSRPLRITVLDVNDNAPVFIKSHYYVTVRENSRLRYLRVRANDVDRGYNGVVRYRIIGGNTDGVFAINDITGGITEAKRIDYEVIGGQVVLEVRASDLGRNVQLSSTAQVVITITDVNDNSPVFRRGAPTSFQVLENILGPMVGTFKADDTDSGSNARVTYSIVGGNDEGRFTISPLDGELRVTHGIELDREEISHYNLTICAMDSGSNPRNSTIFTRIEVVDVNDNSPEFVDLPPRVNVSENRVVYSIYRLVAQDLDAGSFGEIEYSIDSDDGTFVVNSKTGTIDLVKPLNREIRKEYRLHVTAGDNPQNRKNSRSTTKPLLVIVTDINDERPKFVGSKPYLATIAENSPPGSILIFTSDPVLALDADEGENAVVTYTIEGEGSTKFAIDSETGILQTTEQMDRDALLSDVIDLTLRASDEGGHYSEAVVRVTVSDVNDNPPRFNVRRVRNRILESVQPGHVAARMTASDPDQGQNGEIFYRIRSGAFDKFTINQKTGIVYLAPGQSLDRETTSQYRLSVVATDRAPTNAHSSTAVVIITVDDVNDSRPKFSTNFQRIPRIQENSPVGTSIATLEATDEDLNSNLVYIMTSLTIYDADGRPIATDSPVDDVMQSDNDVILGWFKLNSTTGKITLASTDMQAETTVDRELCSSVELHFSVRDEASANEEVATSLQEMTLKIDIEDENDNSPVLEILSKDVTVINDYVIVDVMEECVIGTRLIAVVARDIDQGANGKVVFELGDEAGKLVKLENENSGTIISRARIDREMLAPSGGYGWINVTLVAHDLGYSSRRITRLKVRMRVIDVNDNNPVFPQRLYEASVEEDADVGTIVTSLSAKDADDGDFGDVTYRIFGGLGVFEIHPRTGVITVGKPLDREQVEKYRFTVIARDNMKRADEYKETPVQVVVMVNDVNDNVPVFIQPNQKTITVFENAVPGTSVTIVTATDPDDGPNGHVTYSLHSFADFFTIDPFSGDISISRQVVASRRHPLTGNLTITASDDGALSSNLTLQLEIIDVNDHMPQFHQPEFNIITIMEEEPGGLLVTQVNATDDDLGLNGVVRYKLHDPDLTNEKAFYIDDVTGRIVTSRKLDRELRQTYALMIQAHDLGNPQLQSSKILTIHLNDIDDNRPTFSSNDRAGASQLLNVPEDAAIGSTVGHVRRATDRDENARIYYHILSQDGDVDEKTFRIERNRIIVNRKLDRERVSRYTLIIGATNNRNFTKPFVRGRWDATAQQQVEPAALSLNRINHPIALAWDPSRDPTLLRLSISVDDVIDKAPTFSRDHYVIAVETGTRAERNLHKMNVTDRDVGDVVTYEILRSKMVLGDNTTSEQRNDFVINRRNGIVSTSKSITSHDGYYILTLRVRDSANLSDTATLSIHVFQRSRKLQFVIECPPDVVRAQREEFTDILRNLTGSIVMIDDVIPHVTSDKQRDFTRSDVSIRVFDMDSSEEGILQKLRSGTSKIRLFNDYRFYEETSAKYSDSDFTVLRVSIVLLSLLLLLIIVAFVVYIIHMRRTYRQKIEKLRESQFDDVTVPSEGPIWKPRTHVGSEKKSSENSRQESGGSELSRGNYPKPSEQLRGVKRSFTTDAPALSSTLLWSPSTTRRSARSTDAANRISESDTHDVFEYDDINLHATGCDKRLTPLHGSDSGSSF